MITFDQIWASSTDLLKRFDLFPDYWTSWAKVSEEVFECTEAFIDLKSHPRNALFKSAAASEVCDVIVTLMNLLYTLEADKGVFGLTSFSTLWQRAEDSNVPMTRRDHHVYFQDRLYSLHTDILVYEREPLKMEYPYHRGRIGRKVRDVLMALMKLCLSYRLTLDDIEGAMESVMHKNGLKSHETHEVVNGMICKRKPAPESEVSS